MSNVLSSKTPEQALQELPKILKDAEHVPVDLIPLRRCMAGKWKEIVGKIAGDLHISGIKDLSSVQTVLQNSFKVHPDFKGVPYPHLQEQLEADWQSGMCDIYPAIQKKLEEAASKDIPSLQSEKALQDALKALRTLEETLSEDPFPIKSDADKAKRTSCLEYVKALIQDLLRPIEKEASPKPSEKAGRPEMVAATEPLAEAQPVEQIETIPTAISHKHLRGVVISTVASTLGLLSGAALTTRLAGGGYQEFQSGIEIQVFLGIAAATYGTLAANALSRVPRKWKKAAQAALTMGQAALFAAPSVIASASGGELVSRIFDKAVSAVAAGLAAKALNKPVQETIKERMGEGPLSAVVVEVASAACFQAASQAVAFAHLPLESVQSAAGGVKPQRAVSATKTKAAPALSASVGVETEPSSVMAEPVKVEEPSVLKAPPYTSQKSETLSVSAANPLPEVGFFEALWIAGKALVEGGGEGTPVFLPQNQDLARIAGDIPVTQVYSPTPQYVYSTPPTGVGGGVPI